MARVELPISLIFVIMLGMHMKPVSARSFPLCYGKCLLTCLTTYPIPVCAVKCVNDCKAPLPNQSIESYDCTMKCAASKCSTISTKDNPRKHIYFMIWTSFVRVRFYHWFTLYRINWFTDIIFIFQVRKKSMSVSTAVPQVVRLTRKTHQCWQINLMLVTCTSRYQMCNLWITNWSWIKFKACRFLSMSFILCNV